MNYKHKNTTPNTARNAFIALVLLLGGFAFLAHADKQVREERELGENIITTSSASSEPEVELTEWFKGHTPAMVASNAQDALYLAYRTEFGVAYAFTLNFADTYEQYGDDHETGLTYVSQTYTINGIERQYHARGDGRNGKLCYFAIWRDAALETEIYYPDRETENQIKAEYSLYLDLRELYDAAGREIDKREALETEAKDNQ